LRLVLGGEHVVVDVAGGAFGRGAHVHPTFTCLQKACKSGLARAFKAKVHANVVELAEQVERGYDRRITGLVLGARRAGHLAIGQDAALDAKEAPLYVVACDAGSVANRTEVRKAVSEGRAVVWKNKAALGALFGANEAGVAIFAVAHAKIAAEIREARSRSEACRRREVR
jgi:predicted RNA-binding protein YlxR (DUF448 family)